jgi:hypothetical protein
MWVNNEIELNVNLLLIKNLELIDEQVLESFEMVLVYKNTRVCRFEHRKVLLEKVMNENIDQHHHELNKSLQMKVKIVNDR